MRYISVSTTPERMDEDRASSLLFVYCSSESSLQHYVNNDYSESKTTTYSQSSVHRKFGRLKSINLTDICSVRHLVKRKRLLRTWEGTLRYLSALVYAVFTAFNDKFVITDSGDVYYYNVPLQKKSIDQ